ncbi:MAG: hypothetical protein M3179_01050 [Actinomycetota bacterium]|nr:hypothetical protein [Actinomycetota bacterium]
MSRAWVIAIVLAGAAGIVLALAVVRLGVRQTAASRQYVDQPEYAVWGGLVLLQLPAWAVLGVVSAWWASETRALPPDDDRPVWQVGLGWLGSALVIGVLVLAQQWAMQLAYPRFYPDHLVLRVGVMTVVGALAAGVPAVGLWGISRAVAAIDPASPGAVDRFALLWSRQRDLLVVLSLMLAMAVLTTAARLQANNGFTPGGGPPLPEAPPTYILVQGAIFGAILLVLYLPPYYANRRVGERLALTLCPRSEDGFGDAWFAGRDERQRCRAALGLEEGTREHLQRGVVLLAPLLTALATTLVPGIGG